MARALGERSFGGRPQLEVLGKVLKSYLLQVCFQVTGLSGSGAPTLQCTV